MLNQSASYFRPELNGKIVRVISWKSHKGRFAVEVPNSKEKILLRPNCIKDLVETKNAYVHTHKMPRQISSLVHKEEAILFEKLSAIARKSHLPSCILDEERRQNILRQVEQELRKALGYNQLTIDVQGSIRKNTATVYSDTDILINTPGRQITHEDKEKVVRNLKRSGKENGTHGGGGGYIDKTLAR